MRSKNRRIQVQELIGFLAGPNYYRLRFDSLPEWAWSTFTMP